MKKIMIVDDDVTSVAIVKALLEPEFEVVSANTGVEALGELQRSPDLNLILLDMVMPGVSGMDLLKVLKKSENWSNISVIFLTSLEGVDIELEGFTTRYSTRSCREPPFDAFLWVQRPVSRSTKRRCAWLCVQRYAR